VPQRLNSFFTSPELCELARNAQRLAALQQLYHQATPPTLAHASRVIGFERHILTVGAENSAVAAKLRQLAPHILQQLQGDDAEVTGIRVKVQVSLPAYQPERTPPVLDSAGRRHLSDLAKKIGDSPLKRALLRLINR